MSAAGDTGGASLLPPPPRIQAGVGIASPDVSLARVRTERAAGVMSGIHEWGFTPKQMSLEEDFFIDYGAEEEEEIVSYQDPGQLVAALKQKEEEVILAAQLGNALLLENRQLKEQSDKLQQEYADKLQELEQGRHELRLKLESCQSLWESQVGYLERDVRELSSQVQHLSKTLCQAERDKTRAQLENSENTQKLKQQLNTAMEVERVMSSELQTLKQDLQQKATRPQDEELISAMKEQVLRLTQREQAMEKRLENLCQENTELRANLAALNKRLAMHDHLNQQHSQQLVEAHQEVELARSRLQQLQAQVDDLIEEVALQESKSLEDASLLSELDMADLGASKEELTEELGSILQILLPLTQEENSAGCSDDMAQESLNVVLQQLKTVAQSLVQSSGSQTSQLQQDNAELKLSLQSVHEQTEVIRQAIRDRDEAIAKKNLMEAELVRSKNDMMSLNNQLLEAIQRKLELSQELEAWQDDIQIVINQQLRSQQQSEQPQKKGDPHSLALFRKTSKTIFPWSVDVKQDKAHSPWRDWLRRGKSVSYSK